MRSFTAACFLGLQLASSQDIFLAKETVVESDVVDAEVIIVGAGWAGMSAALQLAQHGVSFKVLEAHNYTGGRSHSMQFGSDNVGRFTMEVGSGWLESSGSKGGPEKDVPPLVKLANEMKPPLKTAFVPGSTQNQSNYGHIYTADGIGKDCDPNGSVRKASNAALACCSEQAAKGKWDSGLTLRQALSKCGWDPKTDCEKAEDWAITVDEPGMTADKQRMYDFCADEVYQWWGPDDHYVVDQRPRGYAGVMDEMVKGTSVMDNVVYNTMVTKVAYDDQGVTISTEGGKTYKGKVAITTFPLGVLTRRHRELFEPNVHKKMADVLDGGTYIMSNLTRVYLQFPSVFWNNEDRAFLLAHEPKGDFDEFRNLNRHGNVEGSNILLSFLGNPESVTYENMKDEEVQAHAMKRLRDAFGEDKVPDPVAFYITRWGLDPLAYGCYSTSVPGFDDDKVIAALTKPLKVNTQPRVYMAGEAHCDDESGSTYGAYESGREVAGDYLFTTGRIAKKPKNICWW